MDRSPSYIKNFPWLNSLLLDSGLLGYKPNIYSIAIALSFQNYAKLPYPHLCFKPHPWYIFASIFWVYQRRIPTRKTFMGLGSNLSAPECFDRLAIETVKSLAGCKCCSLPDREDEVIPGTSPPCSEGVSSAFWASSAGWGSSPGREIVHAGRSWWSSSVRAADTRLVWGPLGPTQWSGAQSLVDHFLGVSGLQKCRRWI